MPLIRANAGLAGNGIPFGFLRLRSRGWKPELQLWKLRLRHFRIRLHESTLCKIGNESGSSICLRLGRARAIGEMSRFVAVAPRSQHDGKPPRPRRCPCLARKLLPDLPNVSLERRFGVQFYAAREVLGGSGLVSLT